MKDIRCYRRRRRLEPSMSYRWSPVTHDVVGHRLYTGPSRSMDDLNHNVDVVVDGYRCRPWRSTLPVIAVAEGSSRSSCPSPCGNLSLQAVKCFGNDACHQTSPGLPELFFSASSLSPFCPRPAQPLGGSIREGRKAGGPRRLEPCAIMDQLP